MGERIRTLQEQIVRREQWQSSGEELNILLLGRQRLSSGGKTLLLPVASILYQYLPYCCHLVGFRTWILILRTFLILFYNKAQGKAILFVQNGLLRHTLPQQTLPTPFRRVLLIVVDIYLVFFHIKSGNIGVHFPP